MNSALRRAVWAVGEAGKVAVVVPCHLGGAGLNGRPLNQILEMTLGNPDDDVGDQCVKLILRRGKPRTLSLN